MRVLIIDQDSLIAQSIELLLRSHTFNVHRTDSGEDGIDLAKYYDFDLIILELHLLDVTGFDVLKSLRALKVAAPVLVVSSVVSVEAKVKALRLGADDFLTKPFHKDELIARIHAIVRRSKGHIQSTISIGRLTVNLDEKIVKADGVRVPLTAKEYQIIELLALRKGTNQSKSNLLNHLYGGMDEPEIKIIDVFVCKLRKKLAAAGAGDYIQTNWAQGYAMRDPEIRAAA